MVKTKKIDRNESTHFTIDRTSGQMQFRDSAKGKTPPTGGKVSAFFRGIEDEKNALNAEDVKCELLPLFERNNYFNGKLMTEKDFRKEQKYFINKQRLINRLIHGVGVVCGLEVLKMKRGQIQITEGVALDFCGREIVVPKFVNIDLNDKLALREDKKDAYIWIKYDFSGDEAVPTVAGREEDVNYNIIKENYKIGVGWVLPKLAAEKSMAKERKCSKVEDQPIILAKIQVKKRNGKIIVCEIDEVSHRKHVYSNSRLYELIECLGDKITSSI